MLDPATSRFMEDPVFIAKIAGAVLALAAGVWIGLGMPGLKDEPRPSHGRPINRLNATWMNRMFFKMSARTRRLDAGRLVAPGRDGRKSAQEEEADEDADRPEERIVRLPRG